MASALTKEIRAQREIAMLTVGRDLAVEAFRQPITALLMGVAGVKGMEKLKIVDSREASILLNVFFTVEALKALTPPLNAVANSPLGWALGAAAGSAAGQAAARLGLGGAAAGSAAGQAAARLGLGGAAAGTGLAAGVAGTAAARRLPGVGKTAARLMSGEKMQAVTRAIPQAVTRALPAASRSGFLAALSRSPLLIIPSNLLKGFASMFGVGNVSKRQ